MAVTTDFIQNRIGVQVLLRPDDDNWGPFEFECNPGLPSGVSVSDATATCYAGDGTEEPDLIEDGSVTVPSDTAVQLNFQVPSSVDVGEYHMALTLTLSSGGTKRLVFGPIQVQEL